MGRLLSNQKEYVYNPPNARKGWCAIKVLRAIALFFFGVITAFAQGPMPLCLEARPGEAARRSVVYDFNVAITQSASYRYETADSDERPKMMHVDQSYNGHEVTLAVGQVMEVSLSENPTTGFRWDLKTKAEPACELVASTFASSGGHPGNGGIHRWQFRAVRPGSGEIELEYRRSWEKDAAPAKVYKLGVRVLVDGSSTAQSE
jgi:inhibitor of cysteine peptidase